MEKTRVCADDIKRNLYALGADLCGIASIDRFDQAPGEFHPCNILPTCQSVIVFAKRFPKGTLKCNTTIPYTIVRNILCDKMDKMAVQFCSDIELDGVLAVPTGTVGPADYYPNINLVRDIISSKQCAKAAGLGYIGKNTMLITPEYGNMVWLSVILADTKLEADKLIEKTCPENCSLCIDACPVHAFENYKMKERGICIDHAFGGEDGSDWKIKCYRCREACPHCLGSMNQ